MREARAGDRYLLCSDGLSDPVSHETILEALQIADVAESADRLIELALRGGGPDNVTVVVADVVDYDYGQTQPILAGAVSGDDDQTSPPNTAAGRASAFNPRRNVAKRVVPQPEEPVRDTAVAAADLHRRGASDFGGACRPGHRPRDRAQQLLRHRARRHRVDHARVSGSFLGIALQEPYRQGCLTTATTSTLINAGPGSRPDCRLLRRHTICRRPNGRRSIAGLPTGSEDDAIHQINKLARGSVLPVCLPPPTSPPPSPRPTAVPHSPDPSNSPGVPEHSAEQRRQRAADRRGRDARAGNAAHRDSRLPPRRSRPHPRRRPVTRAAPTPAPDSRRAPDRHRTAPTAAGTRDELPGIVMTTQPQSPVAVTPPLPNRRNAELFLLGFAAVITTVALLLVEANQEQGLRWDLAQYAVAYLALFAGAHLAVRRFAPYADPLLLPVVALLNGLGLVMIHRLDLAEGVLIQRGLGGTADQQMLWTLVGVIGFSLVVIFLRDHRMLARYGYLCGLTGLILLIIPALLPRSMSEQNGAKIWIRVAGLLDSARRVLQDPASHLLRRGAGGQAQRVHQRGQALPRHGPAPAP